MHKEYYSINQETCDIINTAKDRGKRVVAVGTTSVRVLECTATYRGALYFQTMPKKWSRLNKVAVLFEYAVDADGNTHSEYWEWK
jgi:S-adenosylmethionine:tRNA-ribosyltransferase-isomerase (queuine synthetase)